MREEDGGDMGHVVMVLSGGGRYQVLSAAQEPGITPDPAWIDQHFSARAAAEVNSGQGPTAPMPDTRALLAFGCAPGAKGSTTPISRGMALQARLTGITAGRQGAFRTQTAMRGNAQPAGTHCRHRIKPA